MKTFQTSHKNLETAASLNLRRIFEKLQKYIHINTKYLLRHLNFLWLYSSQVKWCWFCKSKT